MLADAEQADSGRQALKQVGYVDAALVFGVPLTTFGLQYLLVRHFEYGAAISALAFGLTYAALAYVLFRNTGKRYALLSETMLAMALVFCSLAIPLALDGEWTSASWAVEAAGVYLIGIRQRRLFSRLFALLLIAGSAVYFVLELRLGQSWAMLDGSWLGCLLLILATSFVYFVMRKAENDRLRDYEVAQRPWVLLLSCLFMALLPFLLLPQSWGSAALAVIGMLVVGLGWRLSERNLLWAGCVYQVLAGLLYQKHLWALTTDWVVRYMTPRYCFAESVSFVSSRFWLIAD